MVHQIRVHQDLCHFWITLSEFPEVQFRDVFALHIVVREHQLIIDYGFINHFLRRLNFLLSWSLFRLLLHHILNHPEIGQVLYHVVLLAFLCVDQGCLLFEVQMLRVTASFHQGSAGL